MSKNGVLLHVTSLNSKYGVGDLGKSAYQFVDYLHNNGYKIWSILPLNPTNNLNCPYGTMASCCFESDWIDLEPFVEQKLLTKKELNSLVTKPIECKAQFEIYRSKKHKLQSMIFDRLSYEQLKNTNKYMEKNKNVYEYSLYKSLCDFFETKDWRNFDEDIKTRKPQAIKKYSNLLNKHMLKYAFFQMIFEQQFLKLKKYANAKGVKLFGDMPVYMEVNSLDVWLNPKLVLLDEKYKQKYFGGVPSDGVNPPQNWGTCIYDWNDNKKQVFEWWKNRLEFQLKYFDKVRIDHFIGLVNCYKIPANPDEQGKWEKSGGQEFFDYLFKYLPKENIVIEDLGTLSNEVISVREKLNLVGMCVLQYAFDGNKNNEHLPNNIRKQSIYYIGTHDNNTAVGFLNKCDANTKNNILQYYNLNQKAKNKQIIVEMLKSIVNSKAKYTIIQMQDLLLQDENCRMNTPGIAENNWDYVMPNNYKNKSIKLKHLINK